jgi:hypothetical protein
MSRKVKSVSYLSGDSRQSVSVNPQTGKFRLNYFAHGKYGSTRQITRSYNLYRFVTHEEVRDLDPVLTMFSGDKIRVYQGGDSTQMVVQAAGIIENHDKNESLRRSLLDKVKKKALQSTEGGDSKQESFPYNLDFGYDDDDYDGIF